jgi:hypothetical protein
MLRFLTFWGKCARLAFWNNCSFANDWQWWIGVPVASAALASFLSYTGSTELTGSPIADGVVAAFLAFIVTWLVAYMIRLAGAPLRLLQQGKGRIPRSRKSAIKEASVLGGSRAHNLMPSYSARIARFVKHAKVDVIRPH